MIGANPVREATGLEVAIVGMACRYPGANDLETYWANLAAGRESIVFPTDEALLLSGCPVDDLFRPDFVRGTGSLEDAFAFDHEFFGVSEAEAEVMDPQHRVFLTCSWEALENAGYAPDAMSATTGVYAGTMANTYLGHHVAPNRERTAWLGAALIALSNQSTYMPNRVSYKLDLTGPSMAINTACSTSLVAIHAACKGLLSGECDVALAGAAAISFPHNIGYRTFGETGGAVSLDGHCRPFDVDAAGMTPASGVGVCVLKRLDDAIGDGDHIYAVILGSAVNNDGRQKIGFLAPSVSGQREVILQALAMAETTADEIAFVEAHGTATPLGDPIEVQALTEAFGQSRRHESTCALTSVKANIGHAQEAAGVGGLIKAALTLHTRTLPPQINFRAPSTELQLEAGGLYIATEGVDWREDERRLCASVSSFGLGGTNAHVVLEQPPVAPQTKPDGRAQILNVSARTPEQLRQALDRLATHFKTHPDLSLLDAARTLQTGRSAFPFRRAVVVSKAEAAASLLSETASAIGGTPMPPIAKGRTAIVFAADAAADPATVDRLCRASPSFALAWGGFAGLAGDHIQAWRHAGSDPSRRERAQRIADLGFAVSIWHSLRALGLSADAVWGFGPGRLAAAVASGAVTLEMAVDSIVGSVSPPRRMPGMELFLDGARIGEIEDWFSTPEETRLLPIQPSAEKALRGEYSVRILASGTQGADWATTTVVKTDAGISDEDPLLLALARAWERGALVDWTVQAQDGGGRRVPLPTYPFAPHRHCLPLVPPQQALPSKEIGPASSRPASSENASASASDDVRVILTERIGEIWREILGCGTLDGGSDFIQLGADSLQFFRLAGVLRETFGIDFEIRALFEASCLQDQVDLVERALIGHLDAEDAMAKGRSLS